MSPALVLGRWLDRALEIVAPRECAACSSPSLSGFCGPCLRMLSPSERTALFGLPLWSAGVYAPPLDQAVKRFKFGSRPDLAESLARLVLLALGHVELPQDVVWVPVPLHRRRLAERGYDQASLLARALARATSGTSAPRALERVLPTERQATLARARRTANVRLAFAVPNARRVRGRNVILVDDVVTTGATAHACCEALDRAGARVAGVACVAAAGREDPASVISALRD